MMGAHLVPSGDLLTCLIPTKRLKRYFRLEKSEKRTFGKTPGYIIRLCLSAALMKLANSGCGSNGRDFSSGWYCTPMNQG